MPTNSNFFTNLQSPTEPKRSHLFLLSIGADDAGAENPFDIPTYVINKVSRPSFEVEEIKHKYLSHEFKYPGGVIWKDVSFTLIEPIDLQASARIASLIQQTGYVIPSRHWEDSNGINHVRSISKSDASRALRNMKILQFDQQENLIESWSFYHAWIKDVSFSELTHDDRGLTNATLTIAYDWAELESTASRDGLLDGNTSRFWNPATDSTR